MGCEKCIFRNPPSFSRFCKHHDTIPISCWELVEATESPTPTGQAELAGCKRHNRMERESRYMVLKHSDIRKFLTAGQQKSLASCALKINSGRSHAGKQPLKCVCVEVDWPMYEKTWEEIEKWG